MKSKAHGKKCLEMGVSESSVDELETEEAGRVAKKSCGLMDSGCVNCSLIIKSIFQNIIPNCFSIRIPYITCVRIINIQACFIVLQHMHMKYMHIMLHILKMFHILKM